MRGRKPKPAQQQINEGDPRKRGVHKLEEKLAAEARATRGLPDCPRYLRGRARYAWNFWKEELEVMNQDHRPDAPMLEGACRAFAQAVEADLTIERDGMLLDIWARDEDGEILLDGDGNPVSAKKVRHPLLTTSNQAWNRVKAFCSEFGLSPVSRTRLTIEKKSPEDDLAKLLSQPRASREQKTTVH